MVQILWWARPGKNEFRRNCANVVVRYLGGDVSLVQEIFQNNDAQQQLAAVAHEHPARIFGEAVVTGSDVLRGGQVGRKNSRSWSLRLSQVFLKQICKQFLLKLLSQDLCSGRVLAQSCGGGYLPDPAGLSAAVTSYTRKLGGLAAAVASYTKNLEDLVAAVTSYTRKLEDLGVGRWTTHPLRECVRIRCH